MPHRLIIALLAIAIGSSLLWVPRISQWAMNRGLMAIEKAMGVQAQVGGWHLDPLRQALVIEDIRLDDELGQALAVRAVELHYGGPAAGHWLAPRYRVTLTDPVVRLLQNAEGHYRLGHLEWPPTQLHSPLIPLPQKVSWKGGTARILDDSETHGILTELRTLNGNFERNLQTEDIALQLHWTHPSGGEQALALQHVAATGHLDAHADLHSLPLALWKHMVPQTALWQPLSGEISGHVAVELQPRDTQGFRVQLTDFSGEAIHLRHQGLVPREYSLGRLQGRHLAFEPAIHHYQAESIEALEILGPGLQLDRVSVPAYDSETTARTQDADPIRIAGLTHGETHIAELLLRGLHPRDTDDRFRMDSLTIHGTVGPRVNAALIDIREVILDPHTRTLSAERGNSQEIAGAFGILTDIQAETLRINFMDDCLSIQRLRFGPSHTKTFKSQGGEANGIEWDRLHHQLRIDDTHLKHPEMGRVKMADLEAHQARFETPTKQLEITRLKGRSGVVRDEADPGKPALALKEIEFHQFHSDPLRSHWRAAQVHVSNAAMQWIIHPDNHFELKGLQSSAGKALDSTAPQTIKKHWTYEIEAIGLTHSEAHVKDFGTTPTTEFTLKDLDLSADDLDTRANDDTDIDAHARIGSRGSIAVEGRLARNPLRAALRLDLQQFRLPLLAPYWNSLSQLALKRGYATLNGELRIIPGEGHHYEFEGDGFIETLEARDPVSGRNILAFKKMTLDDIAISSHPKRFYTRVMDFDQAYLHLVVKPDHHLNLADVFKVEDPARVPSEIQAMHFDASPTQEPPHAAIGLVRFHDSRVDYSDLGIKPQLSTSVRELGGTVRGLSTRRDATAEISLTGRINRNSPARLSGSLEPMDYQDHTDLLLDFTGLNMTSFPQYAGRFSGYRIARGKLNMDLHYQIDHSLIQVENRTVIDRLTLGDKIEEAHHLFVDLALWMLKDNRGNLDIDLPIYGDLENPSYELGTLYAQALVQFFGKLFTTPATLVQDLIPTAHEEESIAFDPGQREVDPKALGSLQHVIDVYKDQEGGVIEITPSANPKTDGIALADEALKQELKESFVHEMRIAGKSVPAREDLHLSDEEIKHQFRRYFQDHHPEHTAAIPLEADDQNQNASLFDAAWQHALEEWKSSPELLLDLAEDRADSIRNRLVHAYDIDEGSIYLRQAEFQTEKNPVPIKVEYFSD